MKPLNTAIIGAGIIGRTHVETLARCAGLRLCAVVDPSPAAAALARSKDVPHFVEPAALLAADLAEAVIVAAPNETHVPIARACLAAGLPVLLEKPVADTLDAAEDLARAVSRSGVPLLVGHHRRHNPIIKAAKKAILEGAIGDLVTANVNATLMKPAAYFDVAWRTQPGQGGPLLINLIHEVDLLRHFFGPVAQVRAVTSHARRGLGVEDTAAAILEFAGGGIASLTITDAGCGPWAWDVSAGENPARFPAHDVFAHAYSGTAGALSLPDLAFWQYPGAPDWTVPMTRSTLPHTKGDPYVAQLDHFAEVARRIVAPAVSCAEGVANMAVVAAIAEAAETGRPVTPKGGPR